MQSLVSDSNLRNYVYLLYLEGKRHYEVINIILRIYLTINFPKILPFFKNFISATVSICSLNRHIEKTAQGKQSPEYVLLGRELWEQANPNPF